MFENFQKVKINNLIQILTLVLFLVINYFYLYSIYNEEVSIDSSYFLSLIEKMNKGYSLYDDLETIYSPLFLVFVAKLKNVLDIHINYKFDLTIIYIFQLINSLLIFILSIKLNLDKILAFVSSVCFLLFSLTISRLEFKLEYSVIFFGLLSLIVLTKNIYSVLLSAFFASLAFLCKQYGLGFFALCIYLIYLNKGSIKHYLIFIFIYLLSLLIFHYKYPMFLEIMQDVDYSSDPNKEKPFLIFLKDNSKKWFIALLTLIKIFPIFLFAFILKMNDKFKDGFSNLLLFGILGFLIQFIFAQLNYYYLLLAPFLVLFVLIQYRFIKNKILKRIYTFLLIVSLFRIGAMTYDNTFNKVGFFHLKDQLTISKSIDEAVSDKKDVYIYDWQLNSFYYISDLTPPKLNYAFGIAVNDKFRANYTKLAKSLIILESSINENSNINSYIDQNYSLVKEIPIILKNSENKIIIFTKK